MATPTPEHAIELVLRFSTNMTQEELDDFLCGASEMLFADYRGEDSEEREVYSIYNPVNSHWRDRTLGQVTRTSLYAEPYDPPAGRLPGGNRLGPGRAPTPVPS